MLCLPVVVSEKAYDLFVILEEENLTRMKAYDPAEVITGNLPAEYSVHRKVRNLILMYATAKDLRIVMELCKEERPREALRYLSHGYRWRAERGDRDESAGYESFKDQEPER
jgi:hypothetical protein